MILRIKSLVFVPRRYVQALFVSHKNANLNTRVFWPIFDYEQRLENRTELEKNIKRRGLLNKFDIEQLYTKWEKFQSCESRMKKLEKGQLNLRKGIGKLKSNKELSAENKNKLEKLIQRVPEVKKECDDACNSYYEIEEEFNNIFLELPNKLLPNVPDEARILSSYESQPTASLKQHHLKYEHCIEYLSEWFFYLRNDAAVFDLIFPLNCTDYFQQHGFVQFRNPDFAKTITVEAAGQSIDDTFEVSHNFHERCSNLVHLVGNGSWLSFLGFLAKIKIDKNLLPIQFVATGKMYQPKNKNEFGLFDVVQSTAVQIFLAGTEEQMNAKFNEAIEFIAQIFEMIDIHFRIVEVSANQLQPAECYGVRFEMYSPSLDEYIEVGSLHNYSDYISKRLQFKCERDENNTFYKPHILGGTVCNVTKLLAIILETHNGNIPKSILAKKFY